jgi:hypothetical protein
VSRRYASVAPRGRSVETTSRSREICPVYPRWRSISSSRVARSVGYFSSVSLIIATYAAIFVGRFGGGSRIPFRCSTRRTALWCSPSWAAIVPIFQRSA